MKAATFISGGRHVPSSRFRIEPVARKLSQDGWTTPIIYGYGDLDQKLPPGVLRKGYRAACRLERALRTAIAAGPGPVVVQRLAIPWWSGPEVFLGRQRPVVLDFDDAIFLDAQGNASRSRLRALRAAWKQSAHVVAGNSWLASHVQEAQAVSIVPTCIDTSAYKPSIDRSVGELVTVGWIGTGGNLKYLYQLIGPLEKLRAGGLRFEVVICSDEVDQRLLSALQARFVRWSSATELETLRSFDIGLMPLFDDDWCRGKCSFKMIQYMAVGKPAVASAVGFNNDVLHSGREGFLVADGQWFEPLRALITDADARAKMGEAARARAVEAFDIAVAVDKYRQILLSLGAESASS